MRSGIVMEIGDKFIIVMTPDGQFKRIPRNKRQCAVGEEITFADRSFFAASRPAMRRTGYAAAAVLFVFLLSTMFMFGGGTAQAVAYVTVDINPSVEVGIDANEKVVEVRGLDEDGHVLAQLIDFRGMSLEQYSAELFAKIQETAMLAGPSATILVTGTVIDERSPLDSYELAEKVKRQIEAAVIADTDKPAEQAGAGPEAAQAAISVTTLSAPKEVRQAAIETGVSTGKLAVGLLAGKEQDKIQIDELRTKSVGQILKDYGGAERIIPADRAGIGKELIELLSKLPGDAAGSKRIPGKGTSSQKAKDAGQGKEKPAQREPRERNSLQNKWNFTENNKETPEKGREKNRQNLNHRNDADKEIENKRNSVNGKGKETVNFPGSQRDNGTGNHPKSSDKERENNRSVGDRNMNGNRNVIGPADEAEKRNAERGENRANSGRGQTGDIRGGNPDKGGDPARDRSGEGRGNVRDEEGRGKRNAEREAGGKADRNGERNAERKEDERAERNGSRNADRKADGNVNRHGKQNAGHGGSRSEFRHEERKDERQIERKVERKEERH